MTADQIKQRGRSIALAARDAEWQRLSRMADDLYACGDYAESEAVLSEMADRLDANVARELGAVPAPHREAVGVAVNEYFGRLCKLIG